MQIYIMRHGQASSLGSLDAERQLTGEGRFEAKVMANWLRNLKINFDYILVSPYIRAQQTCNTLVSILDCADKVVSLDLIIPSGTPTKVHDFIDGLANAENDQHILLISHLPLVSYLVEQLTIERHAPIFQTAAIAQIDYDVENMQGQFVRMVTPNDLC